ASFLRHLGLLVRDRNICPLRVHSWVDIEEHKLEHIWKAVTRPNNYSFVLPVILSMPPYSNQQLPAHSRSQNHYAKGVR
ncbi:hypothetical protein HAX54_017245, partial [Datura stramonium]|nr:hypothetical protein [Datura stramonium]